MEAKLDNEVAERLIALDNLIKMLVDEREAIAKRAAPSGYKAERLRIIADEILRTGWNRESIQSEKWAGHVVMSMTAGSRDDHKSKQDAKKVLAEIVAAGHLKIASEYSTRRGRGLPIYVAP
jgi:hypothetical protein